MPPMVVLFFCVMTMSSSICLSTVRWLSFCAGCSLRRGLPPSPENNLLALVHLGIRVARVAEGGQQLSNLLCLESAINDAEHWIFKPSVALCWFGPHIDGDSSAFTSSSYTLFSMLRWHGWSAGSSRRSRAVSEPLAGFGLFFKTNALCPVHGTLPYGCSLAFSARLSPLVEVGVCVSSISNRRYR